MIKTMKTLQLLWINFEIRCAPTMYTFQKITLSVDYSSIIEQTDPQTTSTQGEFRQKCQCLRTNKESSELLRMKHICMMEQMIYHAI